MMLEKIFLFFTGLLVLAGCSSRNPEIRAVCIREEIGNYIIKWETEPVMQGTMKLYVSNDPDNFDRTRPVKSVDIKDNITVYITSDNITRKYFLLSFNDKYTRIVSSRKDTMDYIRNFRDVGGYYNAKNKMVRWGKVYRSGELSEMSERDSARFSKLGIKTIIDLRTEQEIEEGPIPYKNATIISAPVSLGNIEDIMTRLEEGRIRKGDGVLFMQDLYLQYVTDNSAAFSKVFRELVNPDNYPLVITSTYGKDKVGFLTALLLATLGVPDDMIMRDYSISQEYHQVNAARMRSFARRLTPDAQEALTVMLHTNEAYLDLAFRKIKKDYGTVDKYLIKELNLTEDEISKVRDILLF